MLERSKAVHRTPARCAIENGMPRYGEEITSRFMALEVSQPHALSFHKGCYLGQEVVERVRSRNALSRVLMPVPV